MITLTDQDLCDLCRARVTRETGFLRSAPHTYCLTCVVRVCAAAADSTRTKLIAGLAAFGVGMVYFVVTIGLMAILCR